MKKQIYLAVALAALSIAPLSVAHAGSSIGGLDLDLHPYAGVGIGAFGLEYKDSAFSQSNTVFGGYVKAGVDIGYYLGLELRLGTTATGSTSQAAGAFGPGTPAGNVDASNYIFLSYLAKLQFPVTSQFTPYALIGGTRADIRMSANGRTSGQVSNGFTYGFGLDYNLGNQLSLNGEWVQYLTNVGEPNFERRTGGIGSKGKMWGAVGALTYHF